MPISPAMRRFCLAHANAFLLPAEALDERGVEHRFAELLLTEGRLSEAQLRCLERGFALYWQRCRDLFARAPGSWFPPRQTNLLIVSEPRGILPYLEPFDKVSSLLYTSDLDTHPEYVAFLLIHMERLSLLRSVRAAILGNLSYWFDRDDESRNAFATAAAHAKRPDARSFVALAASFDWIGELLHIPLREPQLAPIEPFLEVEGTGLYVPTRLQAQIVALCDAAEGALHRAVEASAPAHLPARSRTVDTLCDWLRDTRAHAVVLSPEGMTVWAPDMNDPRWMRRELADASDEAVASLHADLRVVDERSRQFLERVRDVDALPTQCAMLETSGGAYVDPARRAVVYKLQQLSFDARHVAAPPYHRLLLGARVTHEWGHLAHAAKIMRVPDENKAVHAQARAELGEIFVDTIAAVPEPFSAEVVAEAATLAHCEAELPAVLSRKTFARIGDYLSNLLMSRLIPDEEMQAYVRTNVRYYQHQNLSVIAALARYAYEVHYLALADMPRSYFFSTSRFKNYFIDTGIVSDEDVNALFDAAGRVLACYAIDETKFAAAAEA